MTGKQTLVKWSNGNYVTYQVSNGNWIIRNSSGKQIGIYKAGSTTGKYLTKTYISKPTQEGKNNNKTVTENQNTTDTSSNQNTTVTEKKWVQKTVEEPITDYDEAVKYGKLEVNKAKRNNGHQLECKVIGSNKYKEGEWALVQIPSFNINQYMYIMKVDNSINANDEWVTSLTLLDYPLSISSGESNKLEDENEDTVETNGDEINTNDTTNTTSTTSASTTTSSNSSSRRNTSTKTNTKVKVNTSYSSKTLNSTSSSLTSTKTQSTVKVNTVNNNWGKDLIGWISSTIRKRITGR